jgi:hypothetical protein
MSAAPGQKILSSGSEIGEPRPHSLTIVGKPTYLIRGSEIKEVPDFFDECRARRVRGRGAELDDFLGFGRQTTARTRVARREGKGCVCAGWAGMDVLGVKLTLGIGFTPRWRS